jgi:hypothetical protein
MKTSAFVLLAAIGAVSSGSAAASDELASRLTLGIDAPAASGQSHATGLVVKGSGARYDTLAASNVSVPLRLTAAFKGDVAGYRILSTELSFKSEGTANGARAVNTANGAAPEGPIALDQSFDLPVTSGGPVAQQAIAACNALSASEKSDGRGNKPMIALAVAWRVTSGRFNFKWTNYDHVAPSNDILSNRDYYGEQATEQVETTIDAEVVCEPLVAAPAVASAPAKNIRQVAFTPIESAERLAPSERASSDAPVKTAVVSSTEKPVCNGGMMREISGGAASFVCLCPGNTERVSLGTNAFACEKRGRRH